MASINVMRTDRALPDLKGAAKDLLFGALDGFNKDDKRAWRSIWKRIIGMEPGEMVAVEMRLPRSGPFHRRHMAIEQHVFDAQERFDNFEQFRYWLKVGAGWVDWCCGPKGGVVPVPRSISYAKADQEEFTRYHDAVMQFLRGEHAAKFLWKHLENPADMMETILQGFDE